MICTELFYSYLWASVFSDLVSRILNCVENKTIFCPVSYFNKNFDYVHHPNNKIHENQCTTNIDEVTIFDQLFVTMTADDATSF